MSRPEEAQRAVRSIEKHLKIILEACLEHQGKIYLSEETEKAAEALLAQRLAFHLSDDEDEVIITSALSDFIHYITQSQRRRSASGEVGDQWRVLEQAVNQYNIAKKKNKTSDEERYRRQAQEVVYQMVDTMRQITARFSEYVFNDFRSISDIEIKIRENEFAIYEAEKMNTLFEGFSYEQLARMAGADPFLSNLLNKLLVREIDDQMRELVGVIHQLKRSLTQLMERNAKYQRQNRLINAFIDHYHNNPGFSPGYSLEDKPADAFMVVEPISLGGHPDLADPHQEDTLIEISTRAINKLKSSKSVQEERKVNDRRREKVKVEDPGVMHVESSEDPEQASAREFFDNLPIALETSSEVSSLLFFDFLDIDTTLEIWLLTLMNYYFELSEEDAVQFTMHHVTDPVPRYSGNHLLRDVVFSRRDKSQVA